MDTLGWLETGFRWAGGLGSLAALGVLLSGVWRGLHRSPGRSAGRITALLRKPLFYILTTAAYIALCVWMWQPLPLHLSPVARVIALATGVPLFFSGLSFIIWGRLALGRQYFVSSALGAQLFSAHRLVTGGVYALVRHPIYLGVFLAGLGGVCLYRVWTLVFITLNGITLVARARREEQVLAAEFGQAWIDYCQRVPPFFPCIFR